MEEEREEEETTESLSSSEAETSGASSDGLVNRDGAKVNAEDGVFHQGSTRGDSPMLREEGLIAQMEREAMEVGLGGWFNGNLEDFLESWSGSNSDALASQD